MVGFSGSWEAHEVEREPSVTGQIGPSRLESMRPRQHDRHTVEATKAASLRRHLLRL